MGLLTPFYIAGLAIVSLPLLFHLIRRTPRGRQAFSSLMFLSPSPPRLTRRSRLDNILLLLLRAAALILVALAFARPFLRQVSTFDVESMRGRQIVLLLDRSASMQRDGVWTDAMKEADRVVDQLRPSDRIAIWSFASTMQEELGFDEQQQLAAGKNAALARSRLRAIKPSWSLSDIGTALARAAELLDATDDEQGATSDTVRQIVLISDLQRGADLMALQSYQWPNSVQLDVRRVEAAKKTNATLQVVTDLHQQPAERNSPRVRVTNAADSRAEQFQLRWALGDQPVDADPVDAYVPPGRSLVVRVPLADGTAADRLVLTGDDHDFDNTHYAALQRAEQVRVTYLGNDTANDRTGPRHFLELAFASAPFRDIVLQTPGPNEPLATVPESLPHLVVVTQDPPADRLDQLERYLRRNGTVLYLLSQGTSSAGLRRLMQREELKVEEAEVDDYTLLGEIKFTHPLFAVFSNPRYNDFTKIYFWHYRRVDLLGTGGDQPASDEANGLQVLARFDGGDPALFTQRVKDGSLYVFTSGWHPADSQFARSSKFVSLILNLLEQHLPQPMKNQCRVEEPVTLPEAAPDARRIVHKPDGTQEKLPLQLAVYRDTDQPGIYRLSESGQDELFAVNLPASESNTAPLDVEDLEQFGAKLSSRLTPAEQAERRRHLMAVELENRQKLWRLLIAAALVILLAETWLAGRLSSDQPPAPVAGAS